VTARRRSLACALGLAAALPLVACGVKGPPRPPETKNPSAPPPAATATPPAAPTTPNAAPAPAPASPSEPASREAAPQAAPSETKP
jgi:hypothetical protein